MSEQIIHQIPMSFGAHEDPILPRGEYEKGRFTMADESRYTATRYQGGERWPVAIANCKPDASARGLAQGAGLGTEIALINEERFTAAYYSEPLTQYATGWTDSENLQALLDFIAPRVPVGRRFEFKQAVNSEAFLSEQDDDRAIGSEFKRIEYKGSTINGKTLNRGLTYRLDLDEEGGGILTEELIVARILQRLRRNQFRRAWTAFIAGAELNTGVKWSDGTSKNPNEDIRSAILRSQTAAGVFPNRLLIDLQAWAYRAQGLAAQLTAGSIGTYLQTIDQVAAFLALDEGMLSKAVYTTGTVVTPTKTRITNATVAVFMGQDAPSRDDPTNMKHFVTPVGDGDFRVYRQPVGSKFVDITVEYYDAPTVTSTVGCELLTIT